MIRPLILIGALPISDAAQDYTKAITPRFEAKGGSDFLSTHPATQARIVAALNATPVTADDYVATFRYGADPEHAAGEIMAELVDEHEHTKHEQERQ